MHANQKQVEALTTEVVGLREQVSVLASAVEQLSACLRQEYRKTWSKPADRRGALKSTSREDKTRDEESDGDSDYDEEGVQTFRLPNTPCEQ